MSGQVIVEAPDAAKVELVLSGVDITASENAAIYCKNADELIITLTEGTHNRLTDSGTFAYVDEVNEEPNGALFSKCDLNIGGAGSLTVNASFENGIATKDDLVIEGGTITVHAAMDALREKDSVTVTGGSFALTSGGDGIQASNAEDPDKGWVRLDGGSYVVCANGDAIQAETDLTINGGDYNITTEGKPAGESDSQKGLKAANILTVDGGSFRIISRDDAIHADVDTIITGGTIASVGCMGVNVYWEEQPILWVSHVKELSEGTVLSLRDDAGNIIVETTIREDAVQSVYTSPELMAGGTHALFIDGTKKIEVTLNSGMNAIGDDGGAFTGGYSRGNMAEWR